MTKCPYLYSCEKDVTREEYEEYCIGKFKGCKEYRKLGER